MEVVRLANALGAEVRGLDLSQPLSESAVRELRAHWLEHLVLRFRDQSLTPEAFIAFSRRFGELERHDGYAPELRHPAHPELLQVTATEVGGRRVVFGQQWHSDLSYTLRPALGSCLYCVALPEVGGDTLFANMIMAYERLSPVMRRIVDRLEAVHDLANGRSHRDDTPEQLAALRRRHPPVIQQLVRVHPETGRRALYLSEWMVRGIVGLTDDEGAGLVRFLCEESVREELTFRQTWRVGDVVLWDNRATVHMALADYPPDQQRLLLRTSLVGEPHGRPLQAAFEGSDRS